MLLAVITLLGTAQAGFHQELAALHAPGSDLLFACGSAEKAGRGLDLLASVLGEMPEEKRADFDHVKQFFSTDPVRGGFSTDGGFSGAFGQGQHHVLMLHTTLSAEQIAHRMVTEPGESMAPDGPGFRVHTTGGGEELVTAVQGGVRIEDGTPSEPTAEPEDAVVAALPDAGQGCIIVGNLPEKPPLSGGRFGFYIPLDGAQAGRFVLQMPTLKASPTLSGVAPAVVPDIHTTNPPAAWMTLGFSLASADLSSLIKGDALKKARKLQKFLPLDSGITLGVFMDGQPAVAAVLPLAKEWPAKKVLKHVRVVLSRVKAAVVTPLGADRLMVVADKGTVIIGARKGQVLLASTPELTDALVANVGVPWLDAGERERARDWLLAMEVRTIPPALGLQLTQPLWAGVRMEGDLLVGEAVLPLGEEGWATLLKLAKEKSAARKAAIPAEPVEGGTPL